MKERRQAPRYAFIADAEVTEIITDARHKAKTGDISLSGCFLEMMSPSLEGTEIRVRIFHEDTAFTAIGRVMFNMPNMGMGVMFTSVDSTQLTILLKWIGELSRGAA
jgi:hypothetical protein